MRRLVFPLVVVFILVVRGFSQLATPEPLRKWTIAGGASFQAAVASYDGTNVVFRMPNGSKAQAAAAKLSAEDQQFLGDWQKKQPIKFILPETAGVDTEQVKVAVVREDPANEQYIYSTEHFEFESQGKFGQSLLREVGRDFEATYELLRVLPWNIEPSPPAGGAFHAKLFKTKEAYYAAGGLMGSGGVYRRHEQIFFIPFESIGVKLVGKSYARDDKFDSHTMVHELTHQMMNDWLEFIPQWVIEGTAEYTATLPLHTGHFRVSAAKNGLKDYLDFLAKRTLDGVPEPYPLDQLFSITNEKWNSALSGDRKVAHRLYFTSYLLVYYFMHLDGKGDGQLAARYFRDVGEVVKKAEAYLRELDEFKKQPGVESLPDGRLRWQGNLKPPEKPAVITPEERDQFRTKTLQVLLDGRSEADLMKQIRAAYVRLGIRL